MAGDAILDFQICEISLADSVWKAQTHHRAKCRQNWLSIFPICQGTLPWQSIDFGKMSRTPTDATCIFALLFENELHYESSLGADDGPSPYFPVCQGRLPWQQNNAAK